MTSIISSYIKLYSQWYTYSSRFKVSMQELRVVCVCLLAVATCAAESRRPILRAAPTAVTTGNYVIVLRRSTTIETLHHLLLKASKHSDDSKIHRYTETVAKAFTLKLSPYSVEVVSQIIHVGWVFLCSADTSVLCNS